MDNFGGAVPLTSSQVFPAGITNLTGTFNLNVLGVAGYSYGGHAANQQQQYNAVDSITKVVGNHHGKAGVDFRKILVTTDRLPYGESVSFNGIASNLYALTSGSALNGVVAPRSLCRPFIRPILISPRASRTPGVLPKEPR